MNKTPDRRFLEDWRPSAFGLSNEYLSLNHPLVKLFKNKKNKKNKDKKQMNGKPKKKNPWWSSVWMRLAFTPLEHLLKKKKKDIVLRKARQFFSQTFFGWWLDSDERKKKKRQKKSWHFNVVLCITQP